MKKIALLLALALMTATFSACSGGGDGSGSGESAGAESSAPQLDPMAEDDVFTVRNCTTGQTITIGDSVEHADEVTGGEQLDYYDFENDRVRRANFHDAEGLYLDMLDGEIVSWYFKDQDWEVNTGARIGMSKLEVKELYQGYRHLYETPDDEYLIAFDKSKQPIAYDDDAYYILDISFDENGLASYIGMRTKIAREKMEENQRGQTEESAPAQSGEAQAEESSVAETQQA